MRKSSRFVAFVSAAIMTMNLCVLQTLSVIAAEAQQISNGNLNSEMIDEFDSSSIEDTSIDSSEVSSEGESDNSSNEWTDIPNSSESKFEIVIPDSQINVWVNELSDWDISSIDDTNVYYYISNEEIVENSEIKVDELKSWQNDSDLTEGDFYITFVTIDENKQIIDVSDSRHIMLDKTSPNSFDIEISREKSDDKFVYTIKNKGEIKDSLSGVADYYYSKNSEERISISEGISYDKSNFEFKIYADNEDLSIIVYAEDKAGNSVSSNTLKIQKDTNIPQILEVEIVDSIDAAKIIEPISFGNEDVGNLTNSVYCNNNNYLKIKLKEDNLAVITVKVNDSEQDFKSEDFKLVENGDTKECYISLEKLNLSVNSENNISVTASDFYNESSDCSLGMPDETETPYTLVYHTKDSKDGKIIFEPEGTIKYDDKIYLGAFKDFDLLVTISDDIGLGKYSVYVNENKIKTEDISKDGLILDKATDIEYTMPLKSTELKDLFDENTFSNDGDYNIVVITYDLAGNKHENTFSFTKVTKSPSIKNMKYFADKSVLKYLSFGIFGNEVISISIDVEEKGVKINCEDVVLHWNDKEGNEQTLGASNENGKFVFSNLEIKSYENPYITIIDKLANSSKYYFTNNENNLSETNSSTNLVLEDNPPISKTAIYPDDVYLLNGKNYLGKNFNKHSIEAVMSDEHGLNDYSVSINGEMIANTDLSAGKTNNAGEIVPIKENTYSLSLSNDIITSDGQYLINTVVRDFAGNKAHNSYSFTIDTTSPVIKNMQYTVDKSVLKYLTFGIFGNESIGIAIEANDGNGIGIDEQSVILRWSDANGDEKDYLADLMDKKYVFSNLPIGGEAKPYIVITDLLGNESIYYFEKAANQLTLSDNENILMLENELPTVTITTVVPESYAFDLFNSEDGTTWYPENIAYKITAFDKKSGLNKVIVQENDSEERILTKYNNIDFTKKQYQNTATYTYDITEEGNYMISAFANDNAGNASYKKSLNFNLDKTDPNIVEFQFGSLSDSPSEAGIIIDTYQYYFTEETEARVYVEDLGNSAGFKTVTMYLTSVDESIKTFIVSGNQLISDGDRQYASFTIPIGFKGKVAAIVADNVNHNSGIISADGNIVEDMDIHINTSSIIISEPEVSSVTDANNAPLYNHSIPLTVSVLDTFSGISTVEWSIVNDNKSGTISVDNAGNITSDLEDVVITEDTLVMDSNLITSFDFSLLVESNTNGNEVTIELTDNAGNISIYKTSYSIDTTVPSITAELSNTEAKNQRYYNTLQTVTISVTERNFNPNGLEVLVNGEVTMVQWKNTTLFVGTDDTVHIGQFTLSQDGNYHYNITFVDEAGNMATPISQSEFVIDTTAPIIENNFKDFGADGDTEVYFNKTQTAEIKVTEANFFQNDMNIAVYRLEPGSMHDGGSDEWLNYYFSSEWQDDGDNHTLSIIFNEDGIYRIEMSPIDRAENSAIFETKTGSTLDHTAIYEMDFTQPIIVARNETPVEFTDTAFMDIYNFDRRNDDAPTVEFDDINFASIKYEITSYTPVFENDKEIDVIKPIELLDQTQSEKIFTLSDFELDGIYAVKLIAYDKAGNASALNESTYVHMVNSDVLAYIENSNSKEKTGWYSFEDENGPISKRPDSFTDLSIVVMAKIDSETAIVLRDEDEIETDTGIKADNSESMYGVGLYRYELSRSYFADTYTEDTDTRLYLRVNNEENHVELGEIYIDNTIPTCDIPDNFKNWGWFRGSGTQTIIFQNVSEVLDKEKSVAYVDGKEMKFDYPDDKTVTLILEPGSYSVGMLLVDRAGNTLNIPEVTHLAIGNIRMWIILGISFGVIVLIFATIFAIRYIKNRKNKILKL